MPNMTVPANASGLPAVHRTYGFLTADLRIHLPGLMRRAISRARHEYQHGKARGLTWGNAMSAALRSVWSEAKSRQASLRASLLPPSVLSPLQRAELELISIRCAERQTRLDIQHMAVLHQRVAELRLGA